MNYNRFDYSEFSGQIMAAIGLALLPALIGLIIMGLITRHLAAKKGYTGYFWTGFFLNVIGLIYVAGLPDERQRLP